MKIRVRDRFLVALSGLVLVAGAAAVVMEAFFHFTLAERFHNYVTNQDVLHIVIVVVAALVLLVLGLYCLGMLFRRDKRSKTFVVQKGDAGELAISIKALEGLVQRCIEKHEEIHVSNVSLFNTRDGLVIRLKAGLASGVNIPLTVSNLQKQIKQYVTSCSGVDVKEVRVQVDTTNAKGLKEAPYTENAPAAPAAPATVEVPEVKEEEAAPEKKRPFHQRLFSKEEQPAPMPEAPRRCPHLRPLRRRNRLLLWKKLPPWRSLPLWKRRLRLPKLPRCLN